MHVFRIFALLATRSAAGGRALLRGGTKGLGIEKFHFRFNMKNDDSFESNHYEGDATDVVIVTIPSEDIEYDNKLSQCREAVNKVLLQHACRPLLTSEETEACTYDPFSPNTLTFSPKFCHFLGSFFGSLLEIL